MSFQAMHDYGVRDVVSADEMDIIRENIEFLDQKPNYDSDTLTGTFTTSSATYVSCMTITVETYGGPLEIYAQFAGTDLYADISVDGTYLGDPSFGSAYIAAVQEMVNIHYLFPIAAGTHTIVLAVKRVSSTATVRKMSDSSGGNYPRMHPILWAYGG